jgi:hypothetical protein
MVKNAENVRRSVPFKEAGGEIRVGDGKDGLVPFS